MITESLSKVNGLSDGAYMRSVSKVLAQDAGSGLSRALEHLGRPAVGTQDDLFTFLNGLAVQDAGIIYAPKGAHIAKPIHVIYFSTGRGGSGSGEEGGTCISLASPRLLVVAEVGARVEIIEQFLGAPDQTYWTNSVCEIHVADEAEVSHSCSQEQDRKSVHIKQTHVSQVSLENIYEHVILIFVLQWVWRQTKRQWKCSIDGEKSTYKLVEAEIGGRLSRYSLQVVQLGPDTQTEFSTFTVSSLRQVQDLHSRLVLSHPRGTSRQIHKCIVTHRSGQAVFDGNVKVDRLASRHMLANLSSMFTAATRSNSKREPELANYS